MVFNLKKLSNQIQKNIFSLKQKYNELTREVNKKPKVPLMNNDEKMSIDLAKKVSKKTVKMLFEIDSVKEASKEAVKRLVKNDINPLLLERLNVLSDWIRSKQDILDTIHNNTEKVQEDIYENFRSIASALDYLHWLMSEFTKDDNIYKLGYALGVKYDMCKYFKEIQRDMKNIDEVIIIKKSEPINDVRQGENKWDWKFSKKIEISKGIIRFNKWILKIWKKRFIIADKKWIEKQRDEFVKTDNEKPNYATEWKFFVALRTLLTIISTWKRYDDGQGVAYDFNSEEFKKKYNDLWILFHNFGVRDMGESPKNHLAATKHLLNFCKLDLLTVNFL